MTIDHAAIPSDQSDYACLDFVNSAFTDYRGSGQSTDRLDSPEWRAWFLDRHGMSPDDPGSPPIDQLRALRRDLRRILQKWSSDVTPNRRDLRLLDERLRAAPLRMRVTKTANEVVLYQEPIEQSWAWVMATIVASAIELQRDGDPTRLKICENPDCSWMFYDNTMNRSRQFCSTTPCGSLIRVRRFRQRT
jgi:predicted RNA-binding Zn ribbon-like protein